MSGAKKKIGALRILIALGFCLLASIAFYKFTDCGPCLQEQDYVFMEKVKANLKEVGDAVKVSDIHPGDWEKVCAASGGYYYDIVKNKSPGGPDGPDRIILNGADAYLTDSYDETALIFHHGKNEQGLERVEVYRMTPDKARYESPSAKGDCLSKDEAYLEKRIHHYFRLISEDNLKVESSVKKGV